MVSIKYLDKAIDKLVENGTIKHITVRIGENDTVIYDTFRDNVYDTTLFDMASVTKVMATTTLALIALDKCLLHIDDPVDKFFHTSKPLTVKNLLTHTIGIGYKALYNEGYTIENIAKNILDIPSDIPIGTDVMYSCPGFILLGKILEKIFGQPLNKCFDELVALPLGLNNTSFLPKHRKDIVNSDLNEEYRWIVNDYNCRFLGGVAGNAGLFSNLADVTKYINFLLNRGNPLISEKTFTMAVQNHTENMSEARGLGFLYVDSRYRQTGGLFAEGSIGHCGHTGQSFFVDYRTGLYVIILSDATVQTVKKYGTEHYDEVIEMRETLHKAIKHSLETVKG